MSEFQGIDNTQLGNEITLLSGQINAANYRFLKMIAEFDKRDAWNEGGIRSCAHWLNWKCGIALSAAREKLRVAHCLDDELPQINKAFAKGIVSYSKVRAMTRVATNDTEDLLMTIARHGTASHVEQVVRKFRQVKRTHAQSEQAQATDVQQDKRELVHYRDDEGMWVIHARLPAEAGALVVKAIDSVLAKDVSAETLESSPSQSATFPQKRADALSELTEHYLATVTNMQGSQSLAGHARYQMMVHVDINTLRNQTACCDQHSNQHSNIDEQHWISSDMARRIGCDASIVTAIEDSKGNPLSIGRKSRVVPTHIHKALRLRDKTCRHPGCCATRYLDAHHIVHWADGGDTALDNLVLLCRRHHTALHNGGYHIQMIDHVPVFFERHGVMIPQTFVPQFNSRAADADVSAETLRQQYPLISPETAVSKWQGEALDYSMAVGALLAKGS